MDMADLRKCIGSTRFGIEPHDALMADFPSQPSQKDGLGRMCKPHWNQYTAGLARDAKARKAAAASGADATAVDPTSSEPEPDTQSTRKGRRLPATTSPVADGQGDPG
jgi:hypothetical protein